MVTQARCISSCQTFLGSMRRDLVLTSRQLLSTTNMSCEFSYFLWLFRTHCAWKHTILCSIEFSLDPRMGPLPLQLDFRLRVSQYLVEARVEHPSQLRSHCPGLRVSTLSIFGCSMQVITVLSQDNFDISQVDGRVFQN